MNSATVITLLTIPVLFSVAMGVTLLRRAFARTVLLPEELALATAWVFLVASLIWLGVSLAGSSLLGFGSPWNWLASAHFAFAGFGALTLTALSCRIVSNKSSLKTLRGLLIAHPVAYLITAAGILGFRHCDELGATLYELIFVTQLVSVVFGSPNRMARGPGFLAIAALTIPVITLIPAIAWAWGHPILDLEGMIRYHGLINAIGHVGLGLVAFAWGRPPSHSTLHIPAPRLS